MAAAKTRGRMVTFVTQKDMKERVTSSTPRVRDG